MPVTGLDHYNLCAPRELLDELCEFYSTVIGLEVGERPPFSAFGYWLYTGGHPVLHLSVTDRASGKERHSGFDHAAFKCSDFTGTQRHLTRHGVEFRTARVPGTEITQLFFDDPAGNGIELNFDNR